MAAAAGVLLVLLVVIVVPRWHRCTASDVLTFYFPAPGQIFLYAAFYLNSIYIDESESLGLFVVFYIKI